ncbi:phosphatidylinositol-4-phosphate 5-kinase [Anaeramoeba ignava]|uniref:Phosphatidylinositol-4-phosphate 5-kinase n=1 Tax=Anaeramoeba ignava TaxID=1746090 RepID=A0A9Q0REH6_ANAIG|nr:phosphatidylinositol-4-phosphate 5-kinase [Anaeramoeba ignava]
MQTELLLNIDINENFPLQQNQKEKENENENKINVMKFYQKVLDEILQKSQLNSNQLLKVEFRECFQNEKIQKKIQKFYQDIQSLHFFFENTKSSINSEQFLSDFFGKILQSMESEIFSNYSESKISHFVNDPQHFQFIFDKISQQLKFLMDYINETIEEMQEKDENKQNEKNDLQKNNKRDSESSNSQDLEDFYEVERPFETDSNDHKFISMDQIFGHVMSSMKKKRASIYSKKESQFKTNYSDLIQKLIVAGINESCEKMQKKDLPCNFLVNDENFEEIHTMDLDSSGNVLAENSQNNEQSFLSFVEFSPLVFHKFRTYKNIPLAQYQETICSPGGLVPFMATGGRSGAFFFLSSDNRLILKRIAKQDSVVLLSNIKKFYNYMMANPKTFLPSFYGHYKIRINSSTAIEEYFIRRKNTEKIKKNQTLKDNDLQEKIFVGPILKKLILNQIYFDVKFLNSLNIMDYSLLVGIHFMHLNEEQDDPNLDKENEDNIQYQDEKSKFAEQEIPQRINSEMSKGFESRERGLSKIPFYQINDGGILGIVEDSKGRICIYFLGLIDVLQVYNIEKKLEHGLKAVRYLTTQMSSVDPNSYSQRFLTFLDSIFV